MNIENPEVNPSQDDLSTFIELAQANTDEGWETIDEQLPEHCNDPEFLDWARANTANEESGLRDLAATILEGTDEPLTEKDIANLLTTLMREDDPENPYPSFRAACALAKRSDNPMVEKELESIEAKLNEFVDDDDVSEVAQKYLDHLGVEKE